MEAHPNGVSGIEQKNHCVYVDGFMGRDDRFGPRAYN